MENRAQPSGRARRAAFLALFALALGLGATLRFAHLDERPVHADEATGARILAGRLKGGDYAFDPAHFHGPLLTALAAPWARTAGQHGWTDLHIGTLRAFVATLALLSLALVPTLGLGRGAAIAAILLAATSPLLAYYGRMFIHEPLFVCSGLLALAGLLDLLRGGPNLRSGLVLGVGLGAMAATRETVVIPLAAWGLAACRFAIAPPAATDGTADRSARRFIRARLPAAAVAAVIAAGFVAFAYAPGFRPIQGISAFVSTFFDYEVTAGHEKPFAWYLRLLLLPEHRAGAWWSEAGILALGLLVYLKPAGPERGRGGAAAPDIPRFLMESGLLQLLAFSLIAYKTPWLVCFAWFQICLAAGCGFARLAHRFSGRGRLLAAAALVALLAWHGTQARRATGRLAADGRNPYAYVPTSGDIERWVPWLMRLERDHPHDPDRPLAVVGHEYWPLPWYLRAYPRRVGYWAELPDDAAELPVLLLLPSAADAVARLDETHAFLPGGLREDVLVTIAMRKDLWHEYRNAP